MKITLILRKWNVLAVSLFLLLSIGADAVAADQTAGLPAGSPTGDAAAGASFFDGTQPFQNRGTQCFACHTLGSISPPGGGSLGPDLSGALRKYGGAPGMIAVLAGIPFPTMVPVYRDHPLLPQEQADLAAYLGSSPASAGSMIVFAASIGIWIAAGLYMVLQLLWHRRLGRVRSSLQAR